MGIGTVTDHFRDVLLPQKIDIYSTNFKREIMARNDPVSYIKFDLIKTPFSESNGSASPPVASSVQEQATSPTHKTPPRASTPPTPAMVMPNLAKPNPFMFSPSRVPSINPVLNHVSCAKTL